MFWALPGTSPISSTGNLDPALFGISSYAAQDLQTASNLIKTAGSVDDVCSILASAWTVGGGLIKVASTLTVAGALPGEALYWGGINTFGTAGTVTSVLDVLATSYGFFKQYQGTTTLDSDLLLAHDFYAAIGDQLVSLTNQPPTYSTNLTVWSVSVPDVTTGWLSGVANASATVTINNGDLAMSGIARAVLDIYSLDNGQYNNLVVRVSSDCDLTIPSSQSGTFHFNFQIPSGSLFSSAHYLARFTIISSAGVVISDALFTASQPSATFFNDLWHIIDSGLLNSGQTSTTQVQASPNAVYEEFLLDYPGSDMDLHVYDSQGRHVGIDYDTGEIDLQIPGSTYSGTMSRPERILVPVTGDGEFTVKTIAVTTSGSESYSVIANDVVSHPATLNICTSEINASGTPGSSASIQFAISEIGGQNTISGMNVTTSDLTGPSGTTIPASSIKCSSPGTISAGGEVDATILIPVPIICGVYSGTININSDQGNLNVPIRLDISSLQPQCTVTINQTVSQDPAHSWPIHFNVVFSETVNDFGTGDVSLSGTAGASIAIVTPVGSDDTTYDVAVSGMIGSGTVIASIADGVAHDAAGDPNAASTSNDNSVNFVVSGTPTFTITGPNFGTYAPGQPITINWTANNISGNKVITLCLDKDTKLWDGNEKWIEIDKVAAANCDGSYTIDPGNFLPGTYYVGGYMYDKNTWKFYESHATSTITIPTPDFWITAPTSGTYAPGQSVTITWTASDVSSNSVISLCLDGDTKLWNGNERWIEVDKVTASDGNGSYTFDPGNFLPGTYYVDGYLYDKKLWTFTESHAAGQITIPKPTFTITGPTSGTFAPGQNITIQWDAENVSSNSVISLCLDGDTKLWNGNERWIEVDKVTAADGTGSYTFDPGNYLPGTYYVGGYLYDKKLWTFTESHAAGQITIPKPTFTITGPTSGTFAPGQNITIQWDAENVSSNSVISLCLDGDTKLWNGNERWIEVDKVTAADGTGSYTFDPGNYLPGTYYVGGYVYDKKLWTFTEAHASGQITIPAPSFSLNGPTSGAFTAGQAVTITWTVGNASRNTVISLCYDTDTTLWNKTDHWIEIDKVSAANGNGSYVWDTTKVTPGTYYIGGYMYDKVTHLFTNSHLMQSFTIVANSPQTLSSNVAALADNTGGTDGASLVDNISSLAVTSKDLVFSSTEMTPSSASQRITNVDGENNQDSDELLALNDNKDQLTAVDAAFQDQDTWLERPSAKWLS